VKEYQDCRVPKSEESLFNSLAFLNPNQFFELDIDLRSFSKEQVLKRLHVIQKKNLSPPRLNVYGNENDDCEKLRKLSSSYPNTLFN